MTDKEEILHYVADQSKYRKKLNQDYISDMMYNLVSTINKLIERKEPISVKGEYFYYKEPSFNDIRQYENYYITGSTWGLEPGSYTYHIEPCNFINNDLTPSFDIDINLQTDIKCTEKGNILLSVKTLIKTN